MMSLGLGVLTLVAMAWVVVVLPLWRQGRGQEIRRMPAWLMPAFVSSLFLVAVLGYGLTGHWRDVAAMALLSKAEVNQRHPDDRQAIIRYLTRTLRQQPDQVMVAIQLGVELQASGRLQDALTVFKAVLTKKEALQALGLEEIISRLVQGLEDFKAQQQQEAVPKPPPSSDS